MLVTEEGIEILLNFEQPSKLDPPMLVTELGIVIEVRLVQSLNA